MNIKQHDQLIVNYIDELIDLAFQHKFYPHFHL